MASTSARTEARRQARARLAAKIAERRRREQEELEHLTDFEAALSRRDQAELEMAAAVAGLLELGNTVANAAALAEQPEAEIRRLQKLAARSVRTAAENRTDGTSAAGLAGADRDRDGESTP